MVMILTRKECTDDRHAEKQRDGILCTTCNGSGYIETWVPMKEGFKKWIVVNMNKGE